MRKYLYLWIEKFNRPDSENAEVLFENFGVSLTSEYDIVVSNNAADQEGGEKKIVFNITRNELYQEYFFGTNICDLKVFAGKNGTGKTSLFRIISAILSNDTEYDKLYDLKYVLVFLEDGELCVAKHCKLDVVVQGKFEKYTERDGRSDCMMYYSAAFNARKDMLKNSDHYFDISTDYLLEYSVDNFESAKSVDKVDAYHLLEMSRNIDFVSDYIDDVKKWLNLPGYLSVNINLGYVGECIKKICDKTHDDVNDWMNVFGKMAFVERLYLAAAICRMSKCDNLNDICDFSKMKAEGCRKILDGFGILEHVNAMAEKCKVSLRKAKHVFDVKNDYEDLLEFKKEYNEIAAFTGHFLVMKWRNLSSGEEAMMKFFGRFYDALWDYSSEGNQTVHLMIDEADLYLHPEWQRIWLKNTVDIIDLMLDRYPEHRMKVNLYDMDIDNTKKIDIQIFISSHSPFILSDVPRSNCVLLSQDRNGKSVVANSACFQTFGANIYDIVKNEFFMDDVIGELAKTKINFCLTEMNDILEMKNRIKMLQVRIRREKNDKSANATKWGKEKANLEDELSKKQDAFVQKKGEYEKIISAIDEPILKTKMSQMFDEVNEGDESLELKTIQKYIAVLQEKEAKLKGRSRE